MFYMLARRRLTTVSQLMMAVCVLVSGMIGCRPPGSATAENTIVAGGVGQERSAPPKEPVSGQSSVASAPAAVAAQTPGNDRELLKVLLTLERRSYYEQKQEAKRAKLRREQLRRQKLRQGLKRQSSVNVPADISPTGVSSAPRKAL